MKCPECASRRSTIVQTKKIMGKVRRRRECTNCQHRWTTYEFDAAVFRTARQTLERIREDLKLPTGGW